MKKPVSVVVLPLPLSLAALFSYGILKSLGYIDESTYARFTGMRYSGMSLFDYGEKIIYLHDRDLYSKVLGFIGPNPNLKRMLSFAAFGGNPETRLVYTRLTSVLQKLNVEASRKALGEAFQLAETVGDVWKTRDGLEGFRVRLEELAVDQSQQVITYPLHEKFVRLPVFHPHQEAFGDDEITDEFEVVVKEGRVFELQEKHIALVVGGPVGSGKTSLAATLEIEMKDYIRSLKTRSEFKDLKVSIGVVDLDLSMPKQEAVREKWATDKERVNGLWQPWTVKLAEEAQKRLLEARAKYTITIGDLPGRVTEITEIIATPADGTILITKNWMALKKEWDPFMNSLGIPVFSKIRSRASWERFPSIVTNWEKGKRLNGRISYVNRIRRSSDRFIEWLGIFLLCDILPTQFKDS